MLCISPELLSVVYSPVMTMAWIVSLVMDLLSGGIYHMYDTDSFLGSLY